MVHAQPSVFLPGTEGGAPLMIVRRSLLRSTNRKTKTMLVGALGCWLSAAGAAVHAEDAKAITATTVVCESSAGQRQHCVANTSSGVSLIRATGSATCLLGKNWGYDDQGVWVSDGCGGEFVVGAPPVA